jgi:hypothetical protein
MSKGPHVVLDLWDLKRDRDAGFKAALKAAGTPESGAAGHFMNGWCDILDAELKRRGIAEPCRRNTIIDEENRLLVTELAGVVVTRVEEDEKTKPGAGGRRTKVESWADPFA